MSPGQIENDLWYSDMAAVLGKSKSTIHCCIIHWKQTGSYARRRGQGRKRSTTAREDRLQLQTLRNGRHTAVQLRYKLEQVCDTRISKRMVRRGFKDGNLKLYMTRKAPQHTHTCFVH